MTLILAAVAVVTHLAAVVILLAVKAGNFGK
jgi:hypothetical protein